MKSFLNSNVKFVWSVIGCLLMETAGADFILKYNSVVIKDLILETEVTCASATRGPVV